MGKTYRTGLFIIVDTEGHNKLYFLNDGKSYDYIYKGNVLKTFFCYFDGQKDFKSYEEYKRKSVSIELSKLKKHYELAKTREYFDSKVSLLKYFVNIKEAFNKHDLSKLDLDEYTIYEKEYPTVSRFDIRFQNVLVVEGAEIPDIELKTNLCSYECNPNIDFESYLEFIDKAFELMKEHIVYKYEKQTKDINKEFNKVHSILKSALEKYSRVGILNKLDSNDYHYSECIASIDTFDVNKFLISKNNCLYWFKNNE